MAKVINTIRLGRVEFECICGCQFIAGAKEYKKRRAYLTIGIDTIWGYLTGKEHVMQHWIWLCESRCPECNSMVETRISTGEPDTSAQ